MGDENYLPLIEDMTWSYSRLNTFDSCKYQWFLRYICGCKEEDKFYADYGTFIHKLIEDYYSGKLNKDEMLNRFLMGFSENIHGTRPNGNIVTNYINQGAEYLRNFEPFPYAMVDIEKKVNFEINGYKFVGILDYIGMDDNGEYHIIDNKSRNLKPRSNRKKPTVKDKELDSMLKQLYLYSEGLRQNYGKLPATLCFNCFKAGLFIEEPFCESKFEETIQWALDRIEEIKKCEDFCPDHDYFKCKYICGVSNYCEFDQMCYENWSTDDED